MANIHVIDRGHFDNTDQELTVGMHQNPKAMLIKGLYQSARWAWICGQCGYTELFAQPPRELLELYRRAE
ncbi:hypothetical protein F8S13_24235 [Chloroflexia bacterium SDU3-3]|nr:hypothetical protein F8S13_24235 [Chloroflexia bacterium SDU3-3]